MNDPRRIAAIACFMLVTLRLMIGWQLLYEGFWKIKTLKSPAPWTAAGYLRNAQGPFREFFRGLAGDPDDLDWLDVQKMEARWDRWHRDFEKHYDLTDGKNRSVNQKGLLNRWINGSKTFEVDVETVPEGYNNVIFAFEAAADGQTEFSGPDAQGKPLAYEPGLVRVKVNGKEIRSSDVIANDGEKISFKGTVQAKKGDKVEVVAGQKLMRLKLDEIVRFDESKKRLVVDGARHLTPQERETLISAFREDGHEQLIGAAEDVYKRAKDGISFKEKLSATVRGNPDWVDDKKLQRVGEIQKYRSLLEMYERELANAKQDFQFDHAAHTWGKIQSQRSELAGPVKALDQELKDKAVGMLTVEQLQRGPVPEPWTPLRITDLLTIAGLTVLGALLILGLGTRFAAVTAAVMLFMFYAAMPPWPGVPEMEGPEHSFVVNKNFIEVVALLAIACLPTGRWFGVDGMIGRWLHGRKAAASDPTR